MPIEGSSFSLGLSRSQLNLLADYQVVREQSAINAGSNGFDITVNGHTHLRGGAITTEGAASASRLVTQTLTHESVANKDVAQGSSWSVSLSIADKDKNASNQEKGALAGSSAGYARVQTDVRSNTDSSVGGTVTLTQPYLQAIRRSAMATAERAPLEAKRADAQARLTALYNSEPITGYVPLTTGPGPTNLAGAAQACARAGARGAAANESLAVAAAPAGGDGTGAEGLVMDGNRGWDQWWAQVRAVQAEIAKLDGRITAINTKTYQDASTLSRSPSSLHQPLLQTFDRAKATQELKDGVAVTAAFGKVAFKTAGDVAKAEYNKAISSCGGEANAANCPEADKWKDGGLYKSALHGVVGALSFGQAGGLAALTAEGATPYLKQALTNGGFVEGTPMFDALMLAAKSTVGGGLSGVAGAAAAFSADANNRMMHTNKLNLLIAACASGPANSTSVDCTGIRKMAGVRTDSTGSKVDGLPGLLLQRIWDATGALVGAFLVDASTGDQRYVMDLVDLQKLQNMAKEDRLKYVISSDVFAGSGAGRCNTISLLCVASADGMRRQQLEGIHFLMNGQYTVIYPGSAVRLDQFIFTNDYPEVGKSAAMKVNWNAMAARYGKAMLLLGDYIDIPNDATKFGTILVTRTSETSVRIQPNNFDFDLTQPLTDVLLRSKFLSRDQLTLIGGLLGGGFNAPLKADPNTRINYGPGKPVSVIFDGDTPLPTARKP